MQTTTATTTTAMKSFKLGLLVAFVGALIAARPGQPITVDAPAIEVVASRSASAQVENTELVFIDAPTITVVAEGTARHSAAKDDATTATVVAVDGEPAALYVDAATVTVEAPAPESLMVATVAVAH